VNAGPFGRARIFSRRRPATFGCPLPSRRSPSAPFGPQKGPSGASSPTSTKSLTRDGKRFAFTGGSPNQVWIADINPASIGAGPSVSEVTFTPPFVLADRSTSSRFTASMSGDSSGAPRGCFLTLRNGESKFRWIYGLLFDDDTNGDTTAADGTYTSDPVRNDMAPADANSPLTIRVTAVAQSNRRVTAVDTTPFFIVDEDNPGPLPSITEIDPSTAPAGAEVVIHGNNFETDPLQNIVLFGNRQAKVVSALTTTLTVIVPPDLPPGSVQVTVDARTQCSNAVTFTVAAETTSTPTPTLTPTPLSGGSNCCAVRRGVSARGLWGGPLLLSTRVGIPKCQRGCQRVLAALSLWNDPDSDPYADIDGHPYSDGDTVGHPELDADRNTLAHQHAQTNRHTAADHHTYSDQYTPADEHAHPTPTIDLVAESLEVSQGIQDLNNSVRLVARKRTFVRFHVRSMQGSFRTTAQLRVERGADVVTLDPLNPQGQIVVRPDPNRAQIDHSFLFALPSAFREGTLRLTGVLNPLGSPQEGRVANNTVSATISFEEVPEQTLVVYNISYVENGRRYVTSDLDRARIVVWLRKAFPVSGFRVLLRNEFARRGLPTHIQINSVLFSQRTEDVAAGVVPANARYYGIVDDGGGVLSPSCAMAVPSFVATGAAGPPRADVYHSGWDRDETYGDGSPVTRSATPGIAPTPSSAAPPAGGPSRTLRDGSVP
jgi:hypothetical protein